MLYPPIIEGKLPPFTLNLENNQVELTIPYQNSRGVNSAEKKVRSCHLLIKSVPLGHEVMNVIAQAKTTPDGQEFQNPVTFTIIEDLENPKLMLGEYYKIQIAFGDKDGNIGYYSTPAIVKYTNLPVLTLKQKGEWLEGTFSSLDPSEFLYSSNFIIKNQDNKITEKTEEIYCSSLDNTNNLARHQIANNINPGELYTIYWTITTNNGLTMTKSLALQSQEILEPDYILSPIAKTNQDNGLIQVGIKTYNSQGVDNSSEYENNPIIMGRYQLFRATDADNFTTWKKIKEFDNFSSHLLSFGNNFQPLFSDLNVVQGQRYKYKICQINNAGFRSIGFVSNVVQAEFDHMFLCDENRQLRITFNPKVSTFKEVIQESKIDTIGGKFPQFFRNEQTRYKEFSISGLISYLQDPNNMFQFSRNDNNISTNLSTDNFYKERMFREEVVNWLTDGQIKLLKSPAEGNYFVRLMNVNLSPNDTLSRMLYTFTASAYQVEESDMNLIQENNLEELNLLRIINGELNSSYIPFGKVEKIIFSNVPTAGITIRITFENGTTSNYEIGEMGYYFIPPQGLKVTQISKIRGGSGTIMDSYEITQPIDGAINTFKRTTTITNYKGQSNDIIGNNYAPYLNSFYFYKTAQFIQKQHIQPALELNETNRVVFIDITGEIQTIYVIDQLLFENQYLKILSVGNNIDLQFCIANYYEDQEEE